MKKGFFMAERKTFPILALNYWAQSSSSVNISSSNSFGVSMCWQSKIYAKFSQLEIYWVGSVAYLRWQYWRMMLRLNLVLSHDHTATTHRHAIVFQSFAHKNEHQSPPPYGHPKPLIQMLCSFFLSLFRPLYADRLKMEVNYEKKPPENNRKGTKNLLPQKSLRNIFLLWEPPREIETRSPDLFCVDLIGVSCGERRLRNDEWL